MKKIFYSVTQAALIGLIATVVVSCDSKTKTTAPTTSTANVGTTKKATEPIVFVNSDSLLNNYDYFKEIKGRIESKSKKAQVDLSSKGTAFQQEVAEYQKNAQTMTGEQRASTEQRLARKQQELAAYNQNASSALQNEQAGENEKLYNKVAEFLKVYAKDKGYKMVLTYSKSNPNVLFADENLDVTKDVVSGLNEAYKNKK